MFYKVIYNKGGFIMAFDLAGKAVKNLRLPTVNYNNSTIKIIPAQEGDV